MVRYIYKLDTQIGELKNRITRLEVMISDPDVIDYNKFKKKWG
jgi:hypothetical protein